MLAQVPLVAQSGSDSVPGVRPSDGRTDGHEAT